MRLATLGHILLAIFRVLAISLPIMAVFTTTILVAAGVLAWLTDTSITTPYTLWLATICGLIAWLFIAVFHVRKEKLTLSFQDRHAFLGRLRSQLKDLGYCVRVRESDLQVFRPAFDAALVGGKIRLRVEDGSAYLDGPKMFLEILRKRLRVQNHLDKDLKTFWDAQRRRNERLLRRAQITMQVSGKQWQSVCRQITQVLVQEGAEVQCEVKLMAQSEDGIRERTVEGLIREWLAQKNIPVVITKEHVPGREDGPNLDSNPSIEPKCMAVSVEPTAVLTAEIAP